MGPSSLQGSIKIKSITGFFTDNKILVLNNLDIEILNA